MSDTVWIVHGTLRSRTTFWMSVHETKRSACDAVVELAAAPLTGMTIKEYRDGVREQLRLFLESTTEVGICVQMGDGWISILRKLVRS